MSPIHLSNADRAVAVVVGEVDILAVFGEATAAKEGDGVRKLRGGG